jgi:hypothetical protein
MCEALGGNEPVTHKVWPGIASSARILTLVVDESFSTFKELKPMNIRRIAVVLFSVALFLGLISQIGAESPKTEIRGAAILDHPCGKVAVKHMGLVHDGKLEEAGKLGTREMQDQWNAMPAKDREMMTSMMKEMSKPAEQFAAEIKAGGVLVVEGAKATLTVKQEHKDANGSLTDTLTQSYAIDGANCRITR